MVAVCMPIRTRTPLFTELPVEINRPRIVSNRAAMAMGTTKQRANQDCGQAIPITLLNLIVS